MRSLMITARYDALLPSVQRELAHLARQVGSVDGLIDARWLGAGRSVVLSLTFADAESAAHFRETPFLDELAALPHCRDVYIGDLDIIGGLTALSLQAMQAAAPAELVAPNY